MVLTWFIRDASVKTSSKDHDFSYFFDHPWVINKLYIVAVWHDMTLTSYFNRINQYELESSQTCWPVHVFCLKVLSLRLSELPSHRSALRHQAVTCVPTTGTESVRCTARYTPCAASLAPAARRRPSPCRTSLIGSETFLERWLLLVHLSARCSSRVVNSGTPSG